MYLIYGITGRIQGFTYNLNGYDTCIEITGEVYEYLVTKDIMMLQLDLNAIKDKLILTIDDVGLFRDLTLG